MVYLSKEKFPIIPFARTAAAVLLPAASAPPPPHHPPVGSDRGLQVFAHHSHHSCVIIWGVIKLEPRRQTLNLFYCCNKCLNVSCLTEILFLFVNHRDQSKDNKSPPQNYKTTPNRCKCKRKPNKYYGDGPQMGVGGLLLFCDQGPIISSSVHGHMSDVTVYSITYGFACQQVSFNRPQPNSWGYGSGLTLSGWGQQHIQLNSHQAETWVTGECAYLKTNNWFHLVYLGKSLFSYVFNLQKWVNSMVRVLS